MDGQQHPLEPQAHAPRQEIHVIEEERENHSDRQSDVEYPLDDALVAWKGVNTRVRSIVRSLLSREVACLKRSADQITQRCMRSMHSEQGTSNDDTQSRDPYSRRQRRVSSLDERATSVDGILPAEKELLMKRMARMRRVNKILVDLNQNHLLLETEIRGMIAESQELEADVETDESHETYAQGSRQPS